MFNNKNPDDDWFRHTSALCGTWKSSDWCKNDHFNLPQTELLELQVAGYRAVRKLRPSTALLVSVS